MSPYSSSSTSPRDTDLFRIVHGRARYHGRRLVGYSTSPFGGLKGFGAPSTDPKAQHWQGALDLATAKEVELSADLGTEHRIFPAFPPPHLVRCRSPHNISSIAIIV